MKVFLCYLVLIMFLVPSASAIIAPAPRVSLDVSPTPTVSETLYIENLRTAATTATPTQPPSFFMKITSNPSGAVLWVFGEPSSKSTPIIEYVYGEAFKIPDYPFMFSLKYPGYEDYFFEPVMFNGLNITLHAEMVPLPTMTPATPAVTDQAPPYQAIFTQPPGTPTQSTAQSPAPTTPQGEGQAAAAGTSGSLSITTTPPGAEIFIDNEMKGVSPTLISGLPAGTHALGIVKKGYQNISTTISIEPGRTQDYSTGLIPTESTDVPVTSARAPGFAAVSAAVGLAGLVLLRKITG
jgi:hypothetical protein